MVKIGVIGAGSLAWSATLVRDLCLAPSLGKIVVTFMDIDRERLDIIHAFANRYASEVKSNITFEKTTNRRDAIRGSDVVINTAMAGGHQYYERMREVSEKHGYYRGINSVEWNMVSDYHTIWGYYQFQLALGVATDIEEISPDAWLLQLANPVFELTTLISRETKTKVIGLCHGHLGYMEIAGTLGLDPSKIEFEAIGFNHVIWLTKFKHEGEEAHPLLDEWIEKEAEGYWKVWHEEQANPFDLQMSPAAIDMYKVYGLFPVGDTVRGGTWKYHWDLETKRKWFGRLAGPDSETGWKIYLEMLKDNLDTIASATRDPNATLTEVVPPYPSRESVVPMIDSLVNDKEGVYQVNVLNKGTISGLPNDVAIEIPAKVDGKGAHRMKVENIPGRILKYILQPRMMRMEWALEAFLEGGRDMLFEWLIVDPRTKSTEQVNQALDDILRMPENKEMAEHFR